MKKMTKNEKKYFKMNVAFTLLQLDRYNEYLKDGLDGDAAGLMEEIIARLEKEYRSLKNE